MFSILVISAALCVAAVMRSPEPVVAEVTKPLPHPEFPEFPHYDFIDYSDNALQFPGKKDGWNQLFALFSL